METIENILKISYSVGIALLVALGIHAVKIYLHQRQMKKTWEKWHGVYERGK